MQNSFFLKQLHSLVYILFLFSCARQSSPTGGPKDTIPPTLISSNPRNQSLNFKGNSIELQFSEAVQLNVPKEQLIITPTIDKSYSVKAKKNQVTISWEHPLEDSTTYTFNFREAVKDITERNSARNLRVAFSTGNYIDSLDIRGKVFSALDQKPIKDATVALQLHTDTFNITKHQPKYFTKTDELGNYKLENLKSGLYTVYALQDQNRNLLADTKSEWYAFLSKPIFIDTLQHQIDLQTVKQDTRDLKMTSARPYNTYFNIRSSKNLQTAKITPADTTYLTYAFGSDRANLILYNTFPHLDSLLVNVTLIDSIEHQFDTTLYAKFSKQKVTPEKFGIEISSQSLLATAGIFKATFKFTKPLKEVNFDSLYFQVDSVNTIRFEQKDFTYQQLEKILTINKRFDNLLYKKPEQTEPPSQKTEKQIKRLNNLYMGRGAFISVEQDSSAAAEQEFNPQYYEDLGVITAEMRPTKDKVIFELINQKKEIVRTVIHSSTATFEDLPPGDYTLRIIIDKNGNRKWDAGNYLKKEEPEPVFYYANEKKAREIKLKANFEIGPLLITY